MQTQASPLRTAQASTRPRQQRGLSLIELMVAMTIGLFLLAAIALVYTTTKTGFRYANNTVRMAEDAAFALDTIGRDVRMASFAGCAGSSFTTSGTSPSLVYTYTPDLSLLAGQALGAAIPNPFTGITSASSLGLAEVFTARNAVYGFDANNTAALNALGTSTTDYTKSTAYPMLYLAGGSPQALQLSADMTAATDNLTISANTYSWDANTLFIISDCKQAEVFQADSVSSTAITHAATANASASLSKLYLKDAMVTPLTSSVYFLATRTGASLPSLYRRYFNGKAAVFDELVQNVDAITFQYGENTTNNASGYPTYQSDVYRTTAADVTDWSRVVSVRIGLVLASEEDNLTPDTSPAVDWVGGSFAAKTDRRLRRAYSTTISIRNRTGL